MLAVNFVQQDYICLSLRRTSKTLQLITVNCQSIVGGKRRKDPKWREEWKTKTRRDCSPGHRTIDQWRQDLVYKIPQKISLAYANKDLLHTNCFWITRDFLFPPKDKHTCQWFPDWLVTKKKSKGCPPPSPRQWGAATKASGKRSKSPLAGPGRSVDTWTRWTWWTVGHIRQSNLSFPFPRWSQLKEMVECSRCSSRPTMLCPRRSRCSYPSFQPGFKNCVEDFFILLLCCIPTLRGNSLLHIPFIVKTLQCSYIWNCSFF